MTSIYWSFWTSSCSNGSASPSTPQKGEPSTKALLWPCAIIVIWSIIYLSCLCKTKLPSSICLNWSFLCFDFQTHATTMPTIARFDVISRFTDLSHSTNPHTNRFLSPMNPTFWVANDHFRIVVRRCCKLNEKCLHLNEFSDGLEIVDTGFLAEAVSKREDQLLLKICWLREKALCGEKTENTFEECELMSLSILLMNQSLNITI